MSLPEDKFSFCSWLDVDKKPKDHTLVLLESDMADSCVQQNLKRCVSVHFVHFLCEPSRTEHKLFTVLPVIPYLSICLSLSFISSFFLSHSPSTLFTASSSLSTSADAYHASSVCVCVCSVRAPACQKCCIVFIQSKYGPGCLVM